MLILCYEYTGCQTSVDVVIRLWVGWSGAWFPAKQEIYSSPERPWAPPSLLVSEYRRLLLKRPGGGTDNSPPPSVKVENESPPPPPYAFMVCTSVRITCSVLWRRLWELCYHMLKCTANFVLNLQYCATKCGGFGTFFMVNIL
jgi:hypothetical protein